MAKLKQATLFSEENELLALREEQRKLEAKHKEIITLPARLARLKQEQESTMPPMAEIRERQKLNRFEESLSRGEVENVLRAQSRSLGMMLLLALAAAALLLWALQIFNR